MTKYPWWEPVLNGTEGDLLNGVLDSNFLNDGNLTSELEALAAEHLGCQHAIAVTSGTTALFVALAAIGVGPGDEVIVPDVTFIATANAVSMIGARPVLVDIEPHSLNMDAQAFANAITDRTKAVIPVHVSGRAANLPAIMAVADKHDIVVIEDAAEAFGSVSRGGKLGTIAPLGCFSFSPNKLITTGQGGLVVTNDGNLAARVRQLKDQGRPVRGTGGDDPHPTIGYNFKLTNLQAAVGVAQMANIDERITHQRSLYKWYRDGLKGENAIRLVGFDSDEVPLWVDATAQHRDDLLAYLDDQGIDCRPFWHPLHTQPCYDGHACETPHASVLGPQAFWLPSALSLTADDVAEICRVIRSYFETHVQDDR